MTRGEAIRVLFKIAEGELTRLITKGSQADIGSDFAKRYFLAADTLQLAVDACREALKQDRPIRLFADSLAHQAESERQEPRRAAYDAMQDIVDQLDRLADDLGEPGLDRGEQ